MKKIIFISAMITLLSSLLISQPRIRYNNRDLFMSGSNVAWVNFSNDIGPDVSTPNLNTFKTIFQTVHANGGNSMRLWLHTNGYHSPEFSPGNSSTGLVVGPGANTITDLKNILDLAQQNDIGLMLCLWSFDMIRSTNGSIYINRSKLLLNDTSATRKYIDNALIPMVTAVKGHPAIMSWEVFNEPEGMSIEHGWPDLTSADIPMANIQRFINLVAGAIHRTDSTALVTNGAWSFIALTDVPTTALAKKQTEDLLTNLDRESKDMIEKKFKEKYNLNLPAEKIIREFNRYNAAGANFNYYRDDRLISAGGDPNGTLDFYCAHYYSWGGTALSPFHHPSTYWLLDKPIVIAEFYLNDAFDIPYSGMFRRLLNSGYAGAMTWSWTDDQSGSTKARTKVEMKDLFSYYHNDVVVNPTTGTVYLFKITPTTIENGDSALVEWDTEVGSTVTLNNESVAFKGSVYVKPLITTTYQLATTGQNPSTVSLQLGVYPSGKIFSFSAIPNQIESGEKTLLRWKTARGTTATINGIDVGANDSLEVSPLETTKYTLRTKGSAPDSLTITVSVLAPLLVNRALNKPVTVSSSEAGLGNENPQLAVDGNTNTRWSSGYSDAQQFELDLLEVYEIDKIVLYWASPYAKSYRLGLALEKNQYQLAFNITNGIGGKEIYDSLNLEGRYLKLMLDKRALTSLGFSLWEVEVYGLKKGTSVEGENDKPLQFNLSQNYPNPFNPSTVISYQLSVESKVSLKVFDILGNEVATLVSKEQSAGTYQVSFNTQQTTISAFGGKQLTSGVYFYQLRAGSFVETKKMIMVK